MGSTDAEQLHNRKRWLVKGPEEFRETRVDRTREK
jgi:hypothetical protein